MKLRRRRTTAAQLLRRLRRFERHQSRGLLWDIQRQLFSTITAIERRALDCRDRRNNLRARLRAERLPRVVASEVKRQIKHVDRQRELASQQALFFRTLGDALAFRLFDKYDLKPMAFKESAGGLGDKSGSRLERRILKALLDAGIPAVLCDITNVLRYGDICALTHGFPMPLEVKSSENSNERVTRQIENIRKLLNYYATDEISGLYGLDKVTRVSAHRSEVSHRRTINALIRRSTGEPYVLKRVESGLVYAVIRSDGKRALDALTHLLKEPRVAILNSHKFDGTWSSYEPYTRTIRDVDDAIGFAQGDYSILVAYDEVVVRRLARQAGYTLSVSPDPDWLYQLDPVASSAEQPYFRVSSHLFGRVFFEFVSLRWLVAHACVRGPNAIAEIAGKAAQPTNALIDEESGRTGA